MTPVRACRRLAGGLRSSLRRALPRRILEETDRDNFVPVEKDNLNSLSSAPLSETVVRVLRTLGLGDQSDVEFSPDSNPGRVSIVHGTTADVIWCDEFGVETTST